MREIKFRVWDGVEYCSLSVAMAYDRVGVQDDRDDCFELESFYENIIIEQFTGLKDKNGKEIYEGDILNDDTIVMFGIVDIDDNEMYSSNQVCGFYRKTLNGEDYHMDIQDYDRVTGNIHENKELLDIQN